MNSSVSVLAHDPQRGPSERFVDAVSAASVLGINPKTLQRWSRQGILPAHPIGEGRRRYWRYLTSELDAWLRERTIQTPHQPG